MKKHIHLFTLLCLLFTAVSFAQVNRGIGQGQYKTPKRSTQKIDRAQSATDYYAKELSLDDFQAAAVKQIYDDENDNIKNLMEDTEMTSDVRKEKADALTERIDNKILKILNPEQAEKFQKLKEKRRKH